MSGKFYGVYGFNGGGVYDNWQKVEKAKKFVRGIKFKGFYSRQEAVEFIINGVTNDYALGENEDINLEALHSHTNFFIYAQDLFGNKRDEGNNSAKQSRDVFEMLQQIQCDLQNLETVLREQAAEKKVAQKEAITIFHFVDYA